jgi:hypothetical protein
MYRQLWARGCISFHHQQCESEVVSLSTVNSVVVRMYLFTVNSVDVWVFSFPPPAVWAWGCIPFRCKQCGYASCIPFTPLALYTCRLSIVFSVDLQDVPIYSACKVDVQGVSLSAASSVDVHGVSLFSACSKDLLGVPSTPSSVWTCRVGYSDFNNLMGFTSKKLPYIILNNVY